MKFKAPAMIQRRVTKEKITAILNSMDKTAKEKIAKINVKEG